MAIRAETFRALGGFADELFMYLEDLEPGWRARLAGYRVVVDPGADVFHDYEYGRNPRKSYFLERNRLIFCLSAYSGRQLLLLARAAGHRARDGGPGRQGASVSGQGAGWGWLVRNRTLVRQRRRSTQSLRRVRDRELAEHLTPTFAPGMLAACSASPGEPARARLLAPGQESALRTSSCTSRPARAAGARRNFVGTRTP